MAMTPVADPPAVWSPSGRWSGRHRQRGAWIRDWSRLRRRNRFRGDRAVAGIGRFPGVEAGAQEQAAEENGRDRQDHQDFAVYLGLSARKRRRLGRGRLVRNGNPVFRQQAWQRGGVAQGFEGKAGRKPGGFGLARHKIPRGGAAADNLIPADSSEIKIV